MASRKHGGAATGERGQPGRRSRAGTTVAATMLAIVGLLLSTATSVGRAAAPDSSAQPLDLTNAVVVGPASPTVQERAALQALVEEVEKRSIVRLPLLGTGAAASSGDRTTVSSALGRPLIVVGTAATLRSRGEIPGGLPNVASPGPEGYVIRVDAARKPAPAQTSSQVRAPPMQLQPSAR